MPPAGKEVAWTMHYASEADQLWRSMLSIGSPRDDGCIANNLTFSGPAFPRIRQELRIALFMISPADFRMRCGESRVGLF